MLTQVTFFMLMFPRVMISSTAGIFDVSAVPLDRDRPEAALLEEVTPAERSETLNRVVNVVIAAFAFYVQRQARIDVGHVELAAAVTGMRVRGLTEEGVLRLVEEEAADGPAEAGRVRSEGP